MARTGVASVGFVGFPSVVSLAASGVGGAGGVNGRLNGSANGRGDGGHTVSPAQAHFQMHSDGGVGKGMGMGAGAGNTRHFTCITPLTRQGKSTLMSKLTYVLITALL